MIEIGSPPKLWMPPRPAIIRSAADLPKRATFPFPTYCPNAKLSGFTLLAAVEAIGATVTVPEGVRSKDVAVFLQYRTVQGTSIPPLVTPTDFSSIDTRTATVSDSGSSTVSARWAAAMKVLVGDEAEQVLTGMSSGSKALLIFRPKGTLKGISAQSKNGQITGGNPTLQTIGAGVLEPPVIILGWGTADTSGTPGTPTGTLVTNGTKVAGFLSGAFGSVWCELQNEATANRTWDIGDLTYPNCLASFALAGT